MNEPSGTYEDEKAFRRAVEKEAKASVSDPVWSYLSQGRYEPFDADDFTETVDAIRDAARRHAADVIKIDLNAQFRLGGSEAYFHWVQSLLGLAGDGPIPWDGDERFALYVADSPIDKVIEDYLPGR